ncbi:MAG: M23 family metallopeptidase [Rikenellaceae bacterium]
MAQSSNGCLKVGCLLAVTFIVGVVMLVYYGVSLVVNSNITDKARNVYVSQMERLDVNTTKLKDMKNGIHFDNYGSEYITSFSAMTGEFWDMTCIFFQNSYQQVLQLNPQQQLQKNPSLLSSSMPYRWPIDKSTLYTNIGSFGMRFHPIHKRFIKHKGIDLACVSGNPIYATGDAVVELSSIGQPNIGYGEMLLLNHGNNYQTRYAHLSARFVGGWR